MSRLGRLKETRTERWLREGRGRGECWGHGAGERGGSGPWSEPSSLPAVSGRPRGTAGPPCGWPGARADCPPGPQGIPRAPSPDEECFFDLLSKFQSSRMDDQRCPLEDGQPAAAEATATPALEGRVGESAPTPLQPNSKASPVLCLLWPTRARRLAQAFQLRPCFLLHPLILQSMEDTPSSFQL